MGDNEMKYDNLARSLAMMEDELKRAGERVKIAETRVVKIEEELGAIGENQKQLEVSEEKARRREEKYQEQIKQINIRLKQSESRSEYAEMNISKLHLRIEELDTNDLRTLCKQNNLKCGPIPTKSMQNIWAKRLSETILNQELNTPFNKDSESENEDQNFSQEEPIIVKVSEIHNKEPEFNTESTAAEICKNVIHDSKVQIEDENENGNRT